MIRDRLLSYPRFNKCQPNCYMQVGGILHRYRGEFSPTKVSSSFGLEKLDKMGFQHVVGFFMVAEWTTGTGARKGWRLTRYFIVVCHRDLVKYAEERNKYRQFPERNYYPLHRQMISLIVLYWFFFGYRFVAAICVHLFCFVFRFFWLYAISEKSTNQPNLPRKVYITESYHAQKSVWFRCTSTQLFIYGRLRFPWLGSAVQFQMVGLVFIAP